MAGVQVEVVSGLISMAATPAANEARHFKRDVWMFARPCTLRNHRQTIRRPRFMFIGPKKYFRFPSQNPLRFAVLGAPVGATTRPGGDRERIRPSL